MKSFKIYLQEESERPMRLGDVVKVSTKMEDADFWIHSRHSIDKVGHPTREYNPKHIGVKVTHPDILNPKYAYYMMQHLANSGYFKQFATGSTNLVNIRANHITDIPLGIRQ
jgi:hypothetical protein